MKLTQKTAIVTGAARGLGRAVATAFAQEGARVMLMDIEAQELKKTADHISRIGGTIMVFAGDVSKRSDVKEMAEQAR